MSTLIQSKYNLVVEKLQESKVLMFNTRSTAFCIFDKKTQELLSGKVDPADDNDQEKIQKLKEMGFLVDEGTDEYAQIKLLQNMLRYGNRILSLTIGPTLNCNMRCPYCFQAEQYQGMSEATAQKLIKYIKQYVENNGIKQISISWYGGEPLLEMDRIQQISESIIPFCEEKKVSYFASIITNGYLLDQVTAKRLKDYKVSWAQITIDGLEETHNSRRKLKNGKGSFQQIIKNIDNAKGILPIVIRVNVDENNVDEIDALTDFFLNEKGWGKNPSIYLAPVEKTTDICAADPEKCFQPDEFSCILQRIQEKMYEHGISEIARQAFPYTREVGCSALCANNFVIDSNGDFYTCWNSFGIKEKSIGNLDHPERIGSTGDYVRWLTIPTPDKCKECIYLPLCQGGCPDRRINNDNQPFCSYQTRMYINNLKLAYRSYSDEKAKA